MAMAGVKAGHRKDWTAELLASLNLEDKTDRLPHQLSGGEQQLVAIGVALANRPALILADEPTGELDTESAIQVFELLQSLNRSYQVTVMIVTHYPGVAQYVDRVVHIRDGRISSESFARPTFQRSGEMVEEEYLVVDQAGRLQLPEEHAEKFRQGRLGKAEGEGDQVTIKPVRGPAQPGDPGQPRR